MHHIYTTKEDDVLDAICKTYYDNGIEDSTKGVYNHSVLAHVLMLDENRGLSSYGEYLPAGVKVHLPELPRDLVTNNIIKIKVFDD